MKSSQVRETTISFITLLRECMALISGSGLNFFTVAQENLYFEVDIDRCEHSNIGLTWTSRKGLSKKLSLSRKIFQNTARLAPWSTSWPYAYTMLYLIQLLHFAKTPRKEKPMVRTNSISNKTLSLLHWNEFAQIYHLLFQCIFAPTSTITRERSSARCTGASEFH